MFKVKLDMYKEMVRETFSSVGQAIGTHVMLLVVEHALWKARQKYEEAALIEFSEEGVSFDRLDKLDPDRSVQVVHEFVMSIVATLGRLVGIQLARQLTEQLQEKTADMEAHDLGENFDRY